MKRYEEALRLTQPDYTLRLSLVGRTWAEIQPRWQRFLYYLRNRDRLRFEAAMVVELNPRDQSGQCHIHAFTTGDCLPTSVASQRAEQVGMGRAVGIGRVYDDNGYFYLWKEPTRGASELDAFLARNGNRLLHTTSRFFRSGRVGSPIAGGLDGVSRLLRRRIDMPESDEWVLRPNPHQKGTNWS